MKAQILLLPSRFLFWSCDFRPYFSYFCACLRSDFFRVWINLERWFLGDEFVLGWIWSVQSLGASSFDLVEFGSICARPFSVFERSGALLLFFVVWDSAAALLAPVDTPCVLIWSGASPLHCCRVRSSTSWSRAPGSSSVAGRLASVPSLFAVLLGIGLHGCWVPDR
jgi:hypothetical protein